MTPLWIVGGGGHAKVVIDAVRTSAAFDPVGILDDRADRWGEDVLGVPVRGAASRQAVAALGVGYAVIAIGSNQRRSLIAERLDGLVAWATVVHPTAYVAAGARIGEGTVVFAHAIVQPDARIGNHVILNTACSVDHDGLIEDFAHLAPGVRLAGNVRVGSGALLGVGACVIPGCQVGAWSTVGAGAVVVRDVPAGTTALGVPARVASTGEPDRMGDNRPKVVAEVVAEVVADQGPALGSRNLARNVT